MKRKGESESNTRKGNGGFKEPKEKGDYLGSKSNDYD